MFLFAVAVLTGLGLMFHYRPTPETAYLDLIDLREASGFGFVRGLHYWGGHALVIAAWLHLFGVVASGAYRPPRRLNWTVGVALLALTLGLLVTGSLLPWDETAHRSIAALTPVRPDPAAVAGAAAGTEPSPEIDGATLMRFYALHCGVLPVLTVGLIFYHLRRARRDGGPRDGGPRDGEPRLATTNPPPAGD